MEYFRVNSEQSFLNFVNWAKGFYEKHKYVTFSKPRIGPDRSIDQNALMHVWLTEYAAHLLSKPKKEVTPGELEGMKRTAKKEFYKEFRYSWMIHDVVSPKTGESKKDFTSSSKWKRADMFEFMCWLQATACSDGIVLESKGEFEKFQREAKNKTNHEGEYE